MKNLRVLILLFSANFISGFSTGITIFAIPWYLISTLGDDNGNFLNTVTFGVVTFLSLFWGTWVGTLIDRYNRKRIFQVLNGVDAVLLLSVALITMNMEVMPFPFLALIAGSTIFTFNVHYPNLYAMMQEIFEPKYYAKVNSAIEMQGQVTKLLGIVLGGVLIAGTATVDWWPAAWQFEAWTMSEVFLMDGITYALGFVLISLIPYTPDPTRMARRDGGVFDRIKLGFQYLKDDRPLLVFGIFSYVVFFTLLIMIQNSVPIYISDVLLQGKEEGAMTFALLEAYYAGGAILAGILGISFSKYLTSGTLIRLIIGLAVLTGALYFFWSFTQMPKLFIYSGLLLGLGNAGIRILRITYLVRIVPNYMIGRVNSFFSIANVLMRTLMYALLALPIFSALDNGGNVVYALMILGGLVLISAGVLIARFGSFAKTAVVK